MNWPMHSIQPEAIVERRLLNVDAIRSIATLRAFRLGFRIIVLTALGGTLDRIGGVNAGQDDHLPSI